MNKNKKRFIITLAILFAAFSVVAFAVPFQKNGVFWLSYAFGVIAIAVQLYTIPKSFGGDSVRSKFYGFPIARLSVIYLAVQLVLSIGLMIAASFVPVPIWVAIVFPTLILCVAALGFIGVDAAKDEIERQDKTLTKNVSTVRSLQSKAGFIAGQCDDDSVKAELEKLSEELRFSDPVSSEATEESENELSAILNDLQAAVMEKDTESIKTLCGKAALCLAERNRLCKLNK